MVDVNLLPDELRGREAAERKRLGKTPKVVEFTLTQPSRPTPDQVIPGGTTVGHRPPPKLPVGPVPAAAPRVPPSLPLPQRPERVQFAKGKPEAALGVSPFHPPSGPLAAAPARFPSFSRFRSARVASAARDVLPPASPREAPSIRITASLVPWGWREWLSRLFAWRRQRPARPAVTVPPRPAPIGRQKSLPPRLPPRPVAPVAALSPRRRGWWFLRWFGPRRHPPAMPAPVLPHPAAAPKIAPVIWPAAMPKPVVSAAPPPIPVAAMPPAARPPPVPPPAPPDRPLPLLPPPAKPHAAGRRPKSLAINLIPDEFTKHPELNLSRKFFFYLAAVGMAAFAVLTVSQVISWYLYQMGAEIRELEQINTLKAEQIESYQTLLREAAAVERNLQMLEALLSRQRYWTKVFAALERLTVNDVWFSSFHSTDDGAVELVAHGVNYSSVARQMVAFRDAPDVVSSVVVNGASAASQDAAGQVTAVNFTVLVRMAPQVFQLSQPAPQP